MIGILGGTFDPIHHGHLRIALDAAESLGLEEVRFIPLALAVHREQPLASAEQRLSMLQLAIADHPIFTVDDREIRRGGDSYMVDTLASLHRDMPGKTLCLLLGSDAYNAFLDWCAPDKILQLANLAVLQRPGYHLPDDPELQSFTKTHRCNPGVLANHSSGGIAFVTVTQLEISSSDIRQRIAQNRDPAWLLPPAVIDYINTHALYRRPAESPPIV